MRLAILVIFIPDQFDRHGLLYEQSITSRWEKPENTVSA